MNRARKIIAIYSSLMGAIGGGSVPFLLGELEWPIYAVVIYIMVISVIGSSLLKIHLKKYPAIIKDERDVFITRYAGLCGFSASFLWFVIGGMVLLCRFESEFIKKSGLPVLIIGGMMICFLTILIVSQVMYGKAPKDE